MKGELSENKHLSTQLTKWNLYVCVQLNGFQIRNNIHEMQFGFMPGRGMIEAITGKKYLGKNKQLYFIFVDLEKAFDRVPQEVVQWSMRKLRVEGW